MYPVSHLQAHLDYLSRASYIYTTGFFLDSNFAAFRMVCDYACKYNKPLGFNLSAPYVIGLYKDELQEAIKHADFVFCNEDEGSAFAKQNGLKANNRRGIALKIAKMEKYNMKRPSRTVVVTQGPEPTIVVSVIHEPVTIVQIQEIPVPKVNNKVICDTNGAGDSFVGAFFAELVRGNSVVEAVKSGHLLASQVI